MTDVSFKDYVLDQLRAFSGAAARPMFGGYGLFRNGVMFGLIARDELYFKVDETTRPAYEMRKSRAFVYATTPPGGEPAAAADAARTKAVTMSYWLVPGEVLEDPDALKEWAAQAYDVALKNRKSGPAQPRRRFLAARRTRR